MKKMMYDLYYHKSGMPENIKQAYGEFDSMNSINIIIQTLVNKIGHDDEIIIKVREVNVNVPED